MKILFPVGRMVSGSLYTPKPRMGNDGKPKLGADGKALTSIDFAVAIAKSGEAHWQQTQWGAQIKSIGEAAFGAQAMAPTFAWKIVDGDSVIPNKKNNRPCDQPHYPGNWVLWFSQGWAPKLCNQDGTIVLTEPDSIVPGYFVQVYAEVTDNGKNSQSPGVYLNPDAVALAGYGERIATVSNVDTTAVGFGSGAKPAGMSAAPLGAMTQQQAAGAPPAPAAAVTQPTPNAAFLAPPPPTPTPPAPPAAGPVMTAKAAGATYQSFIDIGWTEAAMRTAGFLV